MKKAFIVAIIASSTIYITGCEDKFTKEWFVAHPTEMIEKYTECLLKDFDQFSTIECRNARDAIHQEKNKPSIKAGYLAARKKLTNKTDTTPIADLNNLGSQK